MESEKLKKIKFKRMLSGYESAMEDLELLKEMASEINSEFSSALAAKKRQDIFESKEIEELAEDNTGEEKESPQRDPLFKKLFRKIVVKCHPDRMDKDLPIKQQAEYLELYDLANNANDEDNMALLIVVAIKLEIELNDDYIEHVEKIEAEKEKLEKEIQNIQGSVAWQWYHTPSENRDVVIDQYIKYMEGLLLKKNKIKKKIMGIGHPRTGTGYTSKILKSMGLKVEHEIMGTDGVVAWQLTSDLEPRPFIPFDLEMYKFDCIIYNVRNPITSIPSIVHTEEKTLEYRSKAANFIVTPNVVKTAVRSILMWDKLAIKKNPDFIYRIEDQADDLFQFLKSKGYKVKEPQNLGPQNTREHPGLNDFIKKQLDRLDDELKEGLNDYCIRYGYAKIF